MQEDRFRSEIYEAALDPEHWPDALRTLSGAMGFIGASCRLLNNATQQHDWIGAYGPASRGKADYLAYYHVHDRVTPLVQAARPGEIVQLRAALSPEELRENQWYNEHLAELGIGDALSVPLFRTARNTALLTVHQGLGRPIKAADIKTFRRLIVPFGKAVRIQAERKELGLRHAVAARALEELSVGVLIVTATRTNAPARQVRLHRRSGRLPYVLKVMSPEAARAIYDRPFAMIIAIEPEARAATRHDLSELFGLSRAEAEVAMALVQGKRPAQIASERDVAMTTTRSQLNSIRKKLGAHSQVELVRLLSGSGIPGAE